MAGLIKHPDVVTIGGRFGWALVRVLAEQHPDWQFLFVMRDRAKVAEAAETGLVARFFGDKIRLAGQPGLADRVRMPGNVSFCSLDEFSSGFRGRIRRLFIPAVPSSRMRKVLTGILDAGVPVAAFKEAEVLSVSKGMETESRQFPHEIMDELLGRDSVVALGGNLAFEFALGNPMLMELAGFRPNTRRVTRFFRGSALMIHQTRNRRKLSLAGPMKNIHSLATGMTAEVFGPSSVSAVATMGLSEYERAVFIVQFPARYRRLARLIRKVPFNFRSVPIAGGAMSDYHLFRFTRNFSAGQAFVRETMTGKSAAQAMAAISREATIESFSSALPTRDLLRQLDCFSPVIEITAGILEGKASPEQGIRQMIRQRNLIPT